MDGRPLGSGQRQGGVQDSSEDASVRNDSEDPSVQCKPLPPTELAQGFVNCLRFATQLRRLRTGWEFKEDFQVTLSHTQVCGLQVQT